MSLHGESRSERKVSRPVWPICPPCFLQRKMSLSGIHKATEMFSWLFEFSLLQFQGLFCSFRTAVGSLKPSSGGPLGITRFKWCWARCSGFTPLWMNLHLPGSILFTLRARPAVSSNPQGSVKRCLCSWIHYLYSKPYPQRSSLG